MITQRIDRFEISVRKMLERYPEIVAGRDMEKELEAAREELRKERKNMRTLEEELDVLRDERIRLTAQLKKANDPIKTNIPSPSREEELEEKVRTIERELEASLEELRKEQNKVRTMESELKLSEEEKIRLAAQVKEANERVATKENRVRSEGWGARIAMIAVATSIISAIATKFIIESYA